MPDVLYESVVEVEERLVLQQDSCQLYSNSHTVTGVTGEQVSVVWACVAYMLFLTSDCYVYPSATFSGIYTMTVI